jgi:hypothetical protein
MRKATHKLLITVLLLFQLLLILTACNTVEPEIEPEEVEYSDFVSFTVKPSAVALDEAITITKNITKEVRLWEYCGTPFALLAPKGTTWNYVFPDMQECATPVTITMQDTLEVSLNEVVLKEGKKLRPGSYVLKFFYTTLDENVSVREFNTNITLLTNE